MISKKLTRQIKVGDVSIGGGAPVVIQSMTNTPAGDVSATLRQIQALAQAGCKIVRIAVPHKKAAAAFKRIRQQTSCPLVADIHFDFKLAIAAIEAGADKVRINPGNIGSKENVRAVIDAARQAGIPVRIGVNSGSLEPDILAKHGHPSPPALVESALRNVRLMESFDFENFIVSIKASDVLTTVDACTLLSEKSDYPQHIGITESGTIRTGSIRSAVGIGILLNRGIGDTVRVSLCGDPVEEIHVAQEILKSLRMAQGPTVLACPTCGRTQIDVSKLAQKVEALVTSISAPINIAVMGCVVNGPGEAKEADIGIAGGAGEGRIFKKGVLVAKVKESELLDTLWKYIQELINSC